MDFGQVCIAPSCRDVNAEHLLNDEARQNIQIVRTVILHCDVMSIWFFKVMDDTGPILNFFPELGVAAQVAVCAFLLVRYLPEKFYSSVVHLSHAW